MAQPLRADAATIDPPRAAADTRYFWFAAGVGSWFAAWGMQSVLFSWLVVGELHASADLVGTTQMAMLLPSLLFLLIGGATADRWDRRVLMMRLHVIAALLVGALAGAIATGWFSVAVLLAYALCIGTAQAFMMPARDALLSEVAGADLMRAVTTTTIVQFGLQALGALVGGSGRWIGTTAALCCQGVVLLAGVVAYRRLRSSPAAAPAGSRAMPPISDGLREVWRSERLRIPVLLAAANALLFMGPYIVCVPLLVRDFYGGDVADLAVVHAMFPLGTIAGSLALLRHGGIERKGLAILLAMFSGSFCLLSFAFGLPFWGLLVAVFAWGITGSVFFNSSRTLVQEAAPPTHRARVLSVYALGLFGAGPIGALQAGILAERYGSFVACGVSGVAMLTLIVLLLLFSRIVEMK